MTNPEDIQIPEEYKEKSRQIEQLWEVFLETGENLDRVVLEMRTILIDAGMGSTEAMKKIAQDHRHLKGFSLRSLYRMLPAEEKQQQASKIRDKRLPNGNDSISKPNVSNETYEIPQPTPNIVDVEPEIQEPETPFKGTEEFIKREKESQLTEQLLKEERAKNTELMERLEQRDKKIEELDGLTTEQAYKMQELDRKLIELSTKVIDIDDNPAGEVDKPTFEQHWNQLVDAECSFCHKITPLIIRHFISGKVVKWIDRDRYKELYGMVPAEV